MADFIKENKVLWTAAILGQNLLLHGAGGTGKCLHPDTEILMYDGSIKQAKSIIQGDILMGDDSSPRTVLSTCSGNDEMYQIETAKGDTFIVNSPHVLTLKCSCSNKVKYSKKENTVYVEHNMNGSKKKKRFWVPNYGSIELANEAASEYLLTLKEGKGEVIDIALNEYLKKSKTWKDQYRMFKVGVNFPQQENVTIDPYFLGLWLGDITQCDTSITSIDSEIINYCRTYCTSLNLIFKQGFGKKNITYKFSSGKSADKGNILKNMLSEFDLINNKHIPKRYLCGSRETRLKVLAGLLDMDGQLTANCYEVTQNNAVLSQDIIFLARSLGFCVTHKPYEKKSNGVVSVVERIHISGEGLETIPVLLARKMTSPKKQNKDSLVCGFKVTKKGNGQYCGFTLDGNGRFLLSNFIVTHNTAILRILAQKLIDRGKGVYCTATTGIAALNMGDGMALKTRTLHSWAGIGLGKDDKDKLLAKVASKKKNRERWQKTDILVVDEVSMLGKDLFEKLDYIGRRIRKCEILPFGGIQLIFSGDFLQLPPIKDDFLFESPVWNRCSFFIVPFLTRRRFDDPQYFELLMRVRKGEQTQDDLRIIQSCVKKYDELNKSLTINVNKKRKLNDEPEIRPTILHSKVVDVSSHNSTELDKLPGDSQIYFAVDNYTPIGAHSSSAEPFYEHMLEETIPAAIQLKAGAQVMLRANLDVEGGLVNGSRGVVLACNSDSVDVKFKNDKRVRIVPHTWEFQDESMIAARTQIPLLLAWSITIHRIQGCTLDYAVCNLGQSIFAEGQAYVALSRVRNINGLYITNFYPKSLKVNKKALAFENTIPKVTVEKENDDSQNIEYQGIVDDNVCDKVDDNVIDENNIGDMDCEEDQNKYKKRKAEEDENSCVVCLSKSKNIAFIPCGHICTCELCHKQVKQCPICRCDIESTVKVYIV